MSDLISRQAAIEAFKKELTVGESKGNYVTICSAVSYIGAKQILESLPTAQHEIIRCKECKHSEHWYKDKRRCFLWHETGIDVFEDGYCNYADMREEQDES